MDCRGSPAPLGVAPGGHLMRTVIAGLLALLVVGACSSPSPSAQASAAASAQAGAVNLVCGTIKNLEVSVNVLKSLDPATTTKDTYSAAIDGVLGTGKALIDNLGVLKDADVTLVKTSWTNLTNAFSAQPTGQSVLVSVAAVKPQAQAMSDALAKAKADLNCP